MHSHYFRFLSLSPCGDPVTGTSSWRRVIKRSPVHTGRQCRSPCGPLDTVVFSHVTPSVHGYDWSSHPAFPLPTLPTLLHSAFRIPQAPETVEVGPALPPCTALHRAPSRRSYARGSHANPHATHLRHPTPAAAFGTDGDRQDAVTMTQPSLLLSKATRGLP